jgi:aminoglycoside phosphotransferase (APT) family kinase protein
MTAPTKVGPYEIVRQLGKSMSDVYLAIHTIDNHQAALKLIKRDSDHLTQQLLEAERRGAAILKDLETIDPRVIKIYDFGDIEGYFFVAMQYVEGRTLAEALRAEHALGPIRGAMIALAICEQLAKFHAGQVAVVHGDIKPSNIHLGPSDTVRLLDFGIAKLLRANRHATLHNFGSPGYCSPERLTRSEVDQQSDLWAVGATLYEMLAGAPPYQADSTRNLENLIRSKRPPRALPASCPRPLRAIVAKALAPEPARRYTSASEFQQDLRAFLEHHPTIAEGQQRGWNPNATIEVARELLRKATRTLRRGRYWWEIAIAVAWFFAGTALWIGGSYAWQRYETRREAQIAAHPPDLQLPNLYVMTADRILSDYGVSSDPSLHDFDWQKAEACLARAVDLGVNDSQTRAKLALSRGYAMLERLTGGEYSENAARRLRIEARDLFASAAMKMPNDPAPHLALARTYVYSLPDVKLAMNEFATAQHLGFVLGRREVEQQGDSLRLLAEREAAADDWTEALQNVQMARRFYQRIPGYDLVETHLQELGAIHAPAPKPGRSRRSRPWR